MIKVNGGKKEIRENMELMEKGKTEENNDNREYYKSRKFSEECRGTNIGYRVFEGSKLWLENWALLGVKEFHDGFEKIGKPENFGKKGN